MAVRNRDEPRPPAGPPRGADAAGVRTYGHRPARVAAVAAALAALRQEHRDVLFLHAVCDLSHGEIAEALGVPVGTVKGWLHRARETAARELVERGVLPGSTPRAVEGSPR